VEKGNAGKKKRLKSLGTWNRGTIRGFFGGGGGGWVGVKKGPRARPKPGGKKKRVVRFSNPGKKPAGAKRGKKNP